MSETLIVVGIILIISSIAAPQLLKTIYNVRVRGAATDLSGLIQVARITAEKKNTYLAVYAGSVETRGTGAFINCSPSSCPSGGNGTTYQTGDPDVPYAADVQNGSATNVPAALSPGFTPETAGTILYFNPQGLPATKSGASYNLSKGVIFYLTDSQSNWAAVSVTPSGRSKVWMWSGTAWH